jgi:hypothetical protein
LGWLRGQFKPALGGASVSRTEAELYGKIAKLKRRLLVLAAVVRLLLVLVRLSDGRLKGERLPDGTAKAQVLEAIDAAKRTLPLKSVVRVLGLSQSRYHAWRRLDVACGLADRPSCPKTHPAQLTAQEMATIKQMVTSNDYRHMPTSTLALYAQRLGKGVRFGGDLGKAGPYTRLAATPNAGSPAQAEGRHPSGQAQRDLPLGCDGPAAAQWHQAVSARCPGQLQPTYLGLATR